MPNTLVHIGVQAPLTRLVIKDAPLRWIALGTIIPDLPWILQRLVLFISDVDPVTLRLYCVIQSSFVYCLVVSLGLSMAGRKGVNVFLILAVNSLFHLLLDAAQIKWGNGINLLIPVYWEIVNYGVFWPEHFLTYLLSFAGVLVFVMLWPKDDGDGVCCRWPGKIKVGILLVCIAAYFASPFLLLERAYQADVHYGRTLQQTEQNIGQPFAIDRGYYNAESRVLSCFANKELQVVDPPVSISASLSVRGHITAENKISIDAYHLHKKHRDFASYLGLLLSVVLWGQVLLKKGWR